MSSGYPNGDVELAGGSQSPQGEVKSWRYREGESSGLWESLAVDQSPGRPVTASVLLTSVYPAQAFGICLMSKCSECGLVPNKIVD